MYLLYKQSSIPIKPFLIEDMKVIKRRPKPFVANMSSMQIGKKHYYYYNVMTFLFRGFFREFKEYDIIINNKIVSKAVLISKVPLYGFLPKKGVHLCYCETIPEARGKGLYPLLLKYIQSERQQNDLYMIVDEDNLPSIKGIEKAGFVKYAQVKKLPNGCFVKYENL